MRFALSLLFLACLSPALAQDPDPGPILIITPQDFGGAPDDQVDDAAAFQDALAALAAWDAQIVDGRPTLAVGPGEWLLENIENRKHSLLISHPVRIACAPGAILVGDLTPGDHKDPPEDWTSKRMLSIQPDGDGELEGVVLEGCTFRFGRTHSVNEQAHAIFVSGPAEGWVRGVQVRDVTCEVIGSGDCVYFGRQTEDVSVVRVHAIDVARNVVSFAGASDASKRRTGFHVDGVWASWTFEAAGQTDGNAVCFEPSSSAPDDRFYDVEVRNVYAPTGSADLTHLVDGVVENVHLSKVSSAKLLGLTARNVWLDCLPGAWGDGVGACWSHTGWPAVFTVEDLVARVDPAGAGVLALRVAQAGIADHDNVVGVQMHGRVQFNGDVVERTVADTSGFYSDPLRVVAAFTVVPDPAL